MEERKTVTLTINGKPVQAKEGSTVFQAAADSGVFIPHYCYHPDLSIAGVCRMCMIEVEKAPKLQIACNTPVAEGMVVRTNTDRVRDTVKNVLELHLINHPLDCPICDKAGECKLQDFYRDYGLYQSRMDFDKVHKPKVVDIGTIVLDAERCILCTRCVRFTAEVTKTNELGIFNRGDRSTLATYDDGPLRNEYTGNLADICPVGALTAKDFRFRQRVWFLEEENSVCTQCARGCNIVASMNPKTKKLFRVEPRRNPEVNSSWMCDRGRWDYDYVSDKRITEPRRKGDRSFLDATWNEFFKDLNNLKATPERVLVGISTHLLNEELVEAFAALERLGIRNVTWIVDEAAAKDRKPYDNILQHRDRTSNAMGFEKVLAGLGGKKPNFLTHAAAREKLRGEAYDWLLLLGMEGEDIPGVENLLSVSPPLTKIVAHLTTEQPWLDRCEWVVPNTTSYEKNGTAVNALGRLQRVRAALPPQASARDAHAFFFGWERGDDREPAPENRGAALAQEVQKLLGVARPVEWRNLELLGVAVSEQGT